jgi:hypothetical protein
MRYFLTLALLMTIASQSAAGTLTKGTTNHKIMIKDSCVSGAGCATVLKLSLMTTLEAQLSPLEVNEFSPNSVLQGNFPLGPAASFRLSDDPNYQAGDTSVKINRTTVFNNISWKQSITMSWKDGRLLVKAKISANQQLGDFAAQEPMGLSKTKALLLSSATTLMSLVGDNLGDQFLNVSGPAATFIKTSNTVQPKSNGDVKLQSAQSLKGTKI